ncbi:hypothetical protein U2044_15580, partial [Listeria monocytogenes]|uniref:hypothetical protein n=1 Tax=Listeria monocytogenes TaxID=1639 RepID=UPI002FDC6955
SALGRDREAVGADEGLALDQPSAVSRGTQLLKNYVDAGHIAVEGAGGDERTYSICAEILNLGLSQEKALDLLEEIWNP